MNTLETVLTAIAATIAAKKQSLGSFTGGYLDAQQQYDQTAGAADDRQMRQQGLDMRGAENDMQIQQMQDQIAHRATQAKQKEDDNLRSILRQSLEPYESNEMYSDGIPEDVAAGARLQLPDGTSINVKEALQKINAVRTSEGKWLHGKRVQPARESLITGEGPEGPVRMKDAPGVVPYVKEPAAPRTPLITGPGGIRTEDKPGVKVYDRPRAGDKPPVPKKATVTIKRGVTADRSTVLYKDPENGIDGVELTRGDVRAKLKAKGLPDSDGMVDDVMKSPAALGKLIR